MKSKTCILFILILASAGLISCKTVKKSTRASDDSGMMYAMIYDHENLPVSGVSIYIGEDKITESDIQGRFVVNFSKPGTYHFILAKDGYENLDSEVKFDPMNVLYFKMINASQLALLAEDAIDKHSYLQAEDFINRAIILEPYRQDVLYLKCILFILENKWEEAQQEINGMIEVGMKTEYVTKMKNLIDEKTSTPIPSPPGN